MSTHPSRSSGRKGVSLLAALTLVTPAVLASYIGGEPPPLCLQCGAPRIYTGGTTGGGLTEGNYRESLPITTLPGGAGPTLDFSLVYNSYNADGSHCEIDTVLGYGWTHSYNALLFGQVGNMFLMGADGRIEKFQLGAGGAYAADKGYFNTLVKNGDGSFTLTDKYKTASHFATVPGTLFLIAGPVYRLQTITDRNGNTITLTYAGGELTAVTDPYGRAIHYTYNATGHLTKETDPLGRTTTFTYDSSGRHLSKVTDPDGKTTQYTYNALNQMTTKVDRDGRTFTYQYQSNLPVGTKDGASLPYYSLANPAGWGTYPTDLAMEQERVYVPSTTSETDGRGNVWKYQYDSHGYPTSVTAPDGSTTTYTYDPATLGLASMTDANGHTTTYQYDAEGNRIKMTDALGNVTTYTYESVFNQMISMTDPNGRVTMYTYDTHGNRTQMTDALRQNDSWTYDSHGNRLSAVDKLGNVTQYQYDPNGNLLKTVDPLGNTTTTSYDADGNRTSLTDANSHTTQYLYDSDNRLIRTTDPLGNTTSNVYDGVGDLISTTDANGHTTTNGYDLRDRRVAVTNALGGVSRTTYDGNNNVVSRTDEDGRTTTYAYDALNRPIRTTDALGDVSMATYDADGNRTSATDANGYTTFYAYDALDRRVQTIDPLGHITTYEYANTGGSACCGASGGSDYVTGTVDGDGKVTYYHYDELNRRYQEVRKSGGTADAINPTDAVTTITYDAENNVVVVTDPNNNSTTNTYDALNRPSSSTNAAGDLSRTFYDPVGNVIETIDPRGNVTTYAYDADNRLIRRSDSVGLVAGASYDAAGNVLSTTNGNGNVTTTTYDALNRVIHTTDPLGHTSTTSYDAVGNRVSRTDRDGNTTTYVYDGINRMIKTVDALGDATTNAYDAAGNKISTTDALEHTTRYTYDADNRRIQETYPDSVSDSRSFGYDATGHIISRLDQNGQTTSYQYNDFYYLTNRQYSSGPNDQYTYDLGGRMTTASRNGWTDSFTYDGANRMITDVQNGRTVGYAYVIASGLRTIGYPVGVNVTEYYDARGRLVEVNDGGSPAVTQYTYDLDNNRLTAANRNGTSASYTYNANDWATQLTHSHGLTPIAGFVYVYDNEGHRLSQMNQTDSTDSETYTYDAIDRLTGFDVGTLSGGTIHSPPLIAESYNLDAVGNWSGVTSNGVTQTRTHNAVNEIATISGAPNPTYDANGNLLGDGRYSYFYDAQDRITAVTRDSDSAVVGQYAYDALGRRIVAIAHAGGVSVPTPVTNVMFYDGARIVEEQDASGAAQAIYTYGRYVDEVLTMSRGLQTYYYHPNALFDVEAITDSGGNPVERYAYDAYGGPMVMDGNYNFLPLNGWGTPHSAISNSFLFTGRQLDEESGLYFYRAQYYDTAKGRFLERDPAGYADGMNLYAYARDNPLFFTEPYGKGAKPPLGGVVFGPGKRGYDLPGKKRNICPCKFGLTNVPGSGTGAPSLSVTGWAADVFNTSGARRDPSLGLSWRLFDGEGGGGSGGYGIEIIVYYGGAPFDCFCSSGCNSSSGWTCYATTYWGALLEGW